MQEFNSVGREEHGKKIRYYVLKRSGDITQLIGKRVIIDGDIRKVLDAEEWILPNGEESERYKFWVWK